MKKIISYILTFIIAINIMNGLIYAKEDNKTVSMMVTKTYIGEKASNGKPYHYKVYIHIDYEALVDHSGNVIGIDSVNTITSDAGDITIGRTYKHLQGTDSISSTGQKATIRGDGLFTIGVHDIGIKYPVEWKVSFKAGEGMPID